MTQHLNSTAHKGGHTLNVVISRESSPIIVGTPSVFDPCLSSNKDKPFGDQLAVQFIINMDKPDCIQRKIRYRKYRGINIKDLIEDLQSSQRLSNCEGSVDELVEAYNKGVQSIRNDHVPSYSKIITLRPETPWYSDKLRSAKKIRRKAERTWRRTSLMVHFEIYRHLCRTMNTLLFEEKKCFYSTKIEECGKDQKKLFKLTKNLMGSNSNVNLPHFTSAELLADKFSNYFMRKATIIRNKIISDTPNSTGDIYMDADIMFNGNMLEMFRPTSEVEVKEIIIKSPNKSCDLDPLPTWLLKKCVDQLLPLITAIINRSMAESVMLLCLR